MDGPAILAASLSRPAVHDRYGNVWQYHSRSDRHSKVACWGIALDLLTASAVLRQHAREGKVVLGINHRMVDFGTGRSKNLDLVIARPEGSGGDETFGSLADRFAVELSHEQRHRLADFHDWRVAPVGAVLAALEAKAAMTAHVRALPRLYDELNSSHLCVHGSSRHALAIGFVMINASPIFVSPDLNKGPLAGRGVQLSTERQPHSLLRTLQKVTEIPRRSNVRENGFDGLGVVVVDAVNDGSRISIVSDEPAPQPGASFHYDNMIVRIAHEYDASFANL